MQRAPNVDSIRGKLYTVGVVSELELTYPREWGYRIIGSHEKLIRQLVAEVMGDLPHTLAHSRGSSKGKYVAMALSVEVRNEEHRDSIFSVLKAHEAVKLVL
jgi:putative lipoic acid-binding regulatory protein